MTGLLVQLEWNPARSEALTVPPAYVFGLMFLHGEESALHVFDRGLRAGHMTLQPMIAPVEKMRLLDFSGSISVQMPMGGRQRFLFDGHATMDPGLGLRALSLDLSMREPPLRAHLTLDRGQRIRYELNRGGEVIRGELNGLAPSDLPPDTGIDPAALRSLQQNMASVTLSARRVEFKVRTEKTDAFLVTVHYGTTALAEIYVSELGQILLAKTTGGYTFTAEDDLR